MRFARLVNAARTFHSSIQASKKIVINVPPLGESITEGSIAAWSAVEGKRVAIDDVIVIVETDKVTVDIKSLYSGVITKQIAVDTVCVYFFCRTILTFSIESSRLL